MRLCGLAFVLLLAGCAPAPSGSPLLLVGLAEADLTPSIPYGLSGYFHERQSTEIRDRLHAKAIVFRQGSLQAALVMCDLSAVHPELTREVRKRAAAATGLPADWIILAATHTHTGPAYESDLRDWVGRGASDQDGYPAQLVAAVTDAIVRAARSMSPLRLRAGSAPQETPISFCRRFVMKDGTVKTWMTYRDENTLREANPIDPEVSVLLLSDESRARAALVNFALHLDTLGGTRWSADFPHDMGLVLRSRLGPEVLPIFCNGCCGNINHSDPRAKKPNSTEVIGTSLGKTAEGALPGLREVTPRLAVRRAVVQVPLQEVEEADLAWAKNFVDNGQTLPMLDLVKARKILRLERFRRRSPDLTLEVHAIRLGPDAAIVTLPGEMFVEFGLAIKKASPFRTTFVVELANSDDTSYVPNRDAYPLGGYEVINSMLAPGGGELLTDTAIRLLKEFE